MQSFCVVRKKMKKINFFSFFMEKFQRSVYFCKIKIAFSFRFFNSSFYYMENKIKLFESKQVRTSWDSEQEKWYFSIVDVCNVLTDQKDYDHAKNYWKVLKFRLIKEGNQSVTNCNQLKLVSPKDGKKYLTDVADTEQLLRIIQSIPSPKAEPFKMWLAQVGSDRLDEIADPEKAILRGADFYRAKGYTEGWINQRLQSIEMRKELTDEWKSRGIEHEKDYAILTNEMTKAWSGMTVQQYKQLKNLKKENLRDNMTNVELVLNMLAEVTTTAISRSRDPETFDESRQIAIEGGSVAKDARLNIEARTGQSVISKLNAKNKQALEISGKTNNEIEITQ